MQVLIIERDRDSGETLKDLLELYGYVGYTAYTRQTVLQALERCQPDAVIAEPSLPWGDGRNLCRELRAHPRCAASRFVVVTASARFIREANGLDADVATWLLKPVEPEVLLRAVSGAGDGGQRVANAPRSFCVPLTGMDAGNRPGEEASFAGFPGGNSQCGRDIGTSTRA